MKEQAKAKLPTRWGDFEIRAYANDDDEHMPHLLLCGSSEFVKENPVNVRIHSECITGDLFGSLKCDCGEQLDTSLKYIKKHGGLLLYLRQEGRGIGLIPKLKAYRLQEQGMNTLDANIHLGYEADQRSYDIAVEILKSLDLKKINLLTNNPEKIKAFDNTGIEVVERIPIEISPNPHNSGYLHDKKTLMGHLLKDDE